MARSNRTTTEAPAASFVTTIVPVVAADVIVVFVMTIAAVAPAQYGSAGAVEHAE